MRQYDLEALRESLFQKAGTLPGEEWRSVVTPKFETDKYMVSNKGRVLSLPRWRNGVKGKRRIWKGKMIKPSPQRSGHVRVNICIDGKTYLIHVHRLIMWAFVGPQHSGMVVRHLDGNPAHNSLENLRYETPWNTITGTFDSKGSTGTEIVIGAALERKLIEALRGNADPILVLEDILTLLKRTGSKTRQLETNAR